MIRIIKKKGKIVKAYRLGEQSAAMQKLQNEKRVVYLGNNKYEVFSQEAVNGKSGHGQVVDAGDYIKIDNAGFPYPNEAEYFEKNHRHISDDDYEQIPMTLDAWTLDEPICPEVEFLRKEKGLVIHEDDPDHYYEAELWGTKEIAAKDAVLVFYSISYDREHNVQDAEFNFVERNEFNLTYDVLDKK